METLLLLSRKLDLSLDRLMAEEILTSDEPSSAAITGSILISSYDGMSIAHCSKLTSGRLFFRKERADYANYTLFGVEGTGFWGGSHTLLGLYQHQEDVEKERKEIIACMKQGVPSYELKYASPVEAYGGKFKLLTQHEDES